MKIEVSDPTYNELAVVLKRNGREINDGKPLEIQRGDAIMPPHDFRMVAIRQNCLIAAAEVYKNTPAAFENKTLFIEIAQEIFNWVLNGENDESKNK